MFLKYNWSRAKYWLYRNIGELDERALKNRSAILFLSFLLFFLDPGVEVVFGQASFGGLGITVNPPQTLPVGLLLFLLLAYRLAVFWVSVLISSGCNKDRARYKAQYDFDPSFEAEEPRMHDKDYIIQSQSEEHLYIWTVRKLIWQFIFPNIVALVCIVYYLTEFIRC